MHNHEERMEHPHDPEHLDPTSFARFVPPAVFARLRSRVDYWSHLAEAGPYRVRLDALEGELDTIDWLAQLARRAVSGDPAAFDLINSWMKTSRGEPHGGAQSPHPHEPPTTRPKDEDGHRHWGAVPFLVDRVFEAALGVVYAAGPDRGARGRGLEALTALLARSVPVVEQLYASVVPTADGEEPPSTLWNLLRQVANGTSGAHGLAECHCWHSLEAVLHTLGYLPAAVEEDLCLNQDHPERLTDRIASVTAQGPTPHLITLHAREDKPFPPGRPAGYEVFFEPGGQAGEVVSWNSHAIDVVVPDAARTGYVWFGTGGAPRRGLSSLARSLAAHLSPPDRIPVLVVDPGRAPIGRPDGRNHLELISPPVIERFTATDDLGRELGTAEAAAGTVVRLSWQVSTNRPENTRISISNGQERLEVGTTGSMLVTPAGDQTYVITATNDRGTTMGHIPVKIPRRLLLGTDALCIRPGGTRRVEVSTNDPAGGRVGLSITTNADGTVVGAVSDAPPPGFPPLDVRLVGESTILVSAPGHASAAVRVYVEQPGGAWANGPDLGTAAVHMALLKTGKVLIFSADPDDFNAMDKVKTFLWNVSTNTVNYPGPPPFPYSDHKNLFCSGHCILSDGRVLVVGGHTHGHRGSTAREVHTFDPDLEGWFRHSEMWRWRWYPTVAPLPDGRALILSGSEGYFGRSNPGDIRGINPDVEVFDASPPTSLSLFQDALPAPDDHAMYPHVFALPGGQLFVHYYDLSKIYSPATPPWRVVRELPSAPRVLRTDPGYVTAVMLPMDSDERRHVRIFVAGGTAARAVHEIHNHTPASDLAEVLEVDTTDVRSAAWRALPDRLPMRRFMSDAVLLPDGTVLIVNGAAKGKHDWASEPVLAPVIYDPRPGAPAFTVMIPATHRRFYHGSALLLPDGRVVVGGHTKKFNPPPEEENGLLQLFSPPYLFRGPRPVILQAPVRARHGHTLEIEVRPEDTVGAVTFIRASSVTHQLNTDQRCFRLQRVSETRTPTRHTLTVQAPVDPTLAPAGYYMLFVVSAGGTGLSCGGVPSVAAMVHLENEF